MIFFHENILHCAVATYYEFIYLLASMVSTTELYPKFFLNYYYYFYYYF